MERLSNMADFAPVAPWQVYAKLFEKDCFPKAYLLLAHDVLANKEGYASLVDEGFDKAHTIIMDNSVIELGVAEGIKPTLDAAQVVGAQIVVLPDALENASETIKLTLAGWEEWLECNDATSIDCMIVPQGESMQEWIRCIEELYNEGVDPEWIGIPRNTPGRICSSRLDLVRIAKVFYPAAKIHLLGFSKLPYDDVLTAHHPDVVSIDSAVPLRASQNSMWNSGYPRGAWWETVIDEIRDPEVVQRMIENYTEMQNWVSQED